jgi:hypothetical protein
VKQLLGIEAQDARVSSGKEEIPPEEERERGVKVYCRKVGYSLELNFYDVFNYVSTKCHVTRECTNPACRPNALLHLTASSK